LGLETNKILGGVGAILLAIPFTNLVGVILVLVAMKGLADDYNDADIFTNALYGFIFGVVGVIALIAVVVMAMFGYAAASTVTAFSSGLMLIIIAFIILYVFSLIAALFYTRALTLLAAKSGENIFNTAGMILLIGSIIPVIGEILKLVAWIIAAVGFFNIKPSTQVFTPTQAVSTTQQTKYCHHCGAPIPADATYCTKCGKKAA
jgi:uncharacterized membrane protein